MADSKAKATAPKAVDQKGTRDSALSTFSTYEARETPNPEDANLVVEITGKPREDVDPYSGEAKA